MGRRDKLTPEREAKILELIRLGLTYEKACLAVGIDRGTLGRWMRRGEAAKSGKFFTFRVAIEKARAEGEVAHVQNIVTAGEIHWTASAWWLERTNFERWGKKQTIKFDPGLLTDAQIARVLDDGEDIRSVLANPDS